MDDDASRRQEELEALQAFYGDDVEVTGPSAEAGPWKIKIASSIDLEVLLPLHYPSTESPTPRVHAPVFVLDEVRRASLEEELVAMYQEETEVVIMWAEHLRDTLGSEVHLLDDGASKQERVPEETPLETPNDSSVRVFQPPTSKFGQPTRAFPASVVLNQANQRTIFRGQPFHPPKSGPSETMIAHVASVESMDQVHWVLAELLFNDKKVAKATHNMIAYRFFDEGCLVSDNDDDGEKGAGAKLAALLDMADCRNVIVVVSRWFGGVLLGSARFKYIASTARDALEEAGFLKK
eukprot:Nitzschia sp. Nitz4//scaffold53_size117307//72413//73395//NITZ4_003773-RA/size117307-augustus-gene-0.93-mRNA-1//1//CDS//3329554214//2987//frame0